MLMVKAEVAFSLTTFFFPACFASIASNAAPLAQGKKYDTLVPFMTFSPTKQSHVPYLNRECIKDATFPSLSHGCVHSAPVKKATVMIDGVNASKKLCALKCMKIVECDIDIHAMELRQ